MPYPRLSKAPIKEAILEILVEAGDGFGLPQIEPLAGKVGAPYSQWAFRGPERERGFKEAYARALGAVRKPPDGIVCADPEKHKTVHFFLDGFSFRQQKPYEGWDAFSSEAFRLWRLYEEAAKPKKVRHVGVRFLNFIEVGLPFDVADVLVNAAPMPVPGLSLGNFTTQVLVAKDAERGPFANVIQSLQLASEREERVHVILDIDAFAPEPHAAAALEGKLESLRELKNEIFFKSVHPSQLEALK